MRINEILIEADQYSPKYRRVAPKLLAEFIKRHCQPWLEETDWGDTVFYRGVKHDKPAFIKKTRTDRRPMDTPRDFHKIFDTILQAVGSVANRTNSLFCTGHKETAEIYGNVYVVIPIGPINYAWSPVWGDWTGDLSNDEDQIIGLLLPEKQEELEQISNLPRFNQQGDINKDRDLIIDRLFRDPKSYDTDLLNEYIKVNDQLTNAMFSDNEVMIQCGSALYIEPVLYTKVFQVI